MKRDGARPAGPARTAAPTGPGGAALVVAALLLLIVGLVTASLLPGLVENQRRELHYDDAALLRDARDDILGYAMRQCSLPPAMAFPPVGEEDASPACGAYLAPDVAHFATKNGLALCYFPEPALLLPGALGAPAQLPGWTLLRPDGTASSKLAFLILSRGQNRLRDADVDPVSRTVTSHAYGARVSSGQNPEQGPRPYDDQLEYVTLDALWKMTAPCRGASAEATALTVSGQGQPSAAAVYGAPGSYAGLQVKGVRLSESNRYLASGHSADESIPCLATRWGTSAWKMLFLLGDPLAPSAIAWQTSHAGGQRNAWYRFVLTFNAAGDSTVHWTCKRFVDHEAGELGGFVDEFSETVTRLEPPATGMARHVGNAWLVSRMPRNEQFSGGLIELSQLEINGVVLPAASGRLEHRSSGHADSVRYLLVQRGAPSRTLQLAGSFRFDWEGVPDPLYGLELRFLVHDLPAGDGS